MFVKLFKKKSSFDATLRWLDFYLCGNERSVHQRVELLPHEAVQGDHQLNNQVATRSYGYSFIQI